MDTAGHGHANEEYAHRIRTVEFALEVSANGKQATLDLDVPERIRPAKVVLHLNGWSGRSGTMELPTTGHVKRQIELKKD